MNEIHALSGAYAVDALDDLERSRFERHLAECADCRAEVASLRETAALMSEATSTPPHPEVRERVLAEIRTVRPLPPSTSPAPLRRLPARFLVAAAAAVAVVAGTVAVHPWTHHQAPLAERVLTATDAVRSEITLPGGGTATIINSAHLGRAVLVAHHLAAPPAGRTYELWLQDEHGTMHPAGLVRSGGDHTVVLAGDSSAARGAGITVEPAGGSRRPTTAPIALYSFKQA